MKTEEFTRAARRALTDRLGRLRGSMEDLGAWFRENVARLIGKHVGEAVRDALAAALGRPASRSRERDDRHDRDDDGDGYGGFGAHDPYGLPDAPEGEDDPHLWGAPQARPPPRAGAP